jgi:predicted AAA+ superfamily ATPase
MINRKDYLNRLINLKDKNLIKVVTGIRRCGKSTLLLLFQEYLLANGVNTSQIININLENGDYRHLTSSELLYSYIERLMSKNTKAKKYYIFLDEVQQVPDFQKAADWLYAKDNVDLYMTGSNAHLLSGELATLLTGRYIEVKMLPLSFKEYASAFDYDANMPELFSNYLTKSSFPGATELDSEIERNAYLEGVFNTVLIKDIVMRYKIADVAMLQSVIEFMFDNIGNINSATKIADTMTSAGRKISMPTVESYLKALEDSFVLYKAPRFDIKGKQRLTTNPKYYAVDMGLRYFLLGNDGSDMGHVLENVVYLELIRRGYKVFVGKVYDTEVDFIAQTADGVEYYQVALTVAVEDTLNRELKSLNKIKNHNPKYILTTDYMPKASYDGVRQLNVYNWLLDRA